jgi:hypothetical protein
MPADGSKQQYVSAEEWAKMTPTQRQQVDPDYLDRAYEEWRDREWDDDRWDDE